MTAAAVVVGVSLVIIVVITAVLTRGWRNRVRRQPDETPQDRHRRDIPDFLPGLQASRAKRRAKRYSTWAAGAAAPGPEGGWFGGRGGAGEGGC